MTQLLMPKATAVWLIDNTGLTFERSGLFAICILLKYRPLLMVKLAPACRDMIQLQITNCQKKKSRVVRLTLKLGLSYQSQICLNLQPAQKGHAMCRLPGVVTSLMQLLGWSNITLNYLMPKSAA